ncbi:hypothetical protein L218DRAFT_992306 [Marasmius fiardii PR-910]|nr:hypothetical protein L218DRAFT_992306 [Marasmius fiardii PR-910]
MVFLIRVGFNLSSYAGNWTSPSKKRVKAATEMGGPVRHCLFPALSLHFPVGRRLYVFSTSPVVGNNLKPFSLSRLTWMAFVGSFGFSIEGCAYNYVQGDQIINNTTHVVQHEKKEKERTIYDEFDYIKRGAIRRLRDIDLESGDERRRLVQWPLVDMRICVAELHREKDQRFMVVSYSGPEAEKAWEQDLLEFSRVRDAKHMQLHGINRSDIPMLIFHDGVSFFRIVGLFTQRAMTGLELVPIGHIWNQISKLGRCYLTTLVSRSNLNCVISNLWIDPKRGTFVRGVLGIIPTWGRITTVPGDKLPSSVDFLQENVFWRYLYQFPLQPSSDRALVDALAYQYGDPVLWSQNLPMEPDGPIVVSSSSNLAIAVGSLGNWCWEPHSEMDIILRGSRCFSYLHRQRHIQPHFQLCGHIRKDQDFRQRREAYGLPIYLVVPLPSHFGNETNATEVSLHFWSNDAHGSVLIPNKTCEYLGLSITLLFWRSVEEVSWPTEVYEMIRKWQVTRGFNPETAEFVKYCEYPMLEAVPSDSGQFNELSEAQ